VPKPITVVVVSDFEASDDKTWKDELSMAAALAAQDIVVPFDVVMVESETHRDATLPEALFAALPELKILYGPSERSADLKDHGVAQVETEWVAVLEADATPEPDWLRRLYDAALAHPEYDVICGRTYYGEETSWRRALNLLDRSFDDQGVDAPSAHISNNGALYRTSVLKAFPYPDAATPFLSSRLRNEKMLAAGHRTFMVREARMRHAIGDIRFVWDVRRHTGYSDMGSLVKRPGLSRVPILTFWRMRHDLRNAKRVGGRYLRAGDWPLYAGLFVVARVPETWGMVESSIGQHRFKGSAYR
jgi:hypothetical protein